MDAEKLLAQERPLPSVGGGEGIVNWHVFRQREAALKFIPGIRLGEGQEIVGGHTADSLGELWWVGVRVADIERWGNRQAVHKHAHRE